MIAALDLTLNFLWGLLYLYLVVGYESFGFALIVFGCLEGWGGLALLVDWVSCVMDYRSLSRWGACCGWVWC